MKYTLFMPRDAVLDAQRARRFYDLQRRGLGAKFRHELALTLRRIESNPLQYAGSEMPGVRRAVLRVFPLAVYYQVMPPRIRIVAVHDCRRDPQQWKERAL
jgi:toxin ParE1/3/4